MRRREQPDLPRGSPWESLETVDRDVGAEVDADARGEPLGDACRDTVAAVAQRDHGEHAPGDLLGRAAVGGVQPGPQPPVQLLGSRMIARHLDARDRTARLPGAVDVSALDLRAVALHGERGGNAGVVAEVHREPAIVLRGLPVARTPGTVAQAVAVDGPGPVADHHAPRRAPVLLEVSASELLTRALPPHADPTAVALLAQLAAVGRREGPILELDACRDVRIPGERGPRVEELQRAFEQARRAVVADHVLAHRRAHLEAHAAGVEAGVVGDPGAAEHESGAAIGQVETERHLGVALVGAVADADEAAEPLRRVVEVVVRALVVVLFAGVLVHQVVGVETDPANGAHARSSITRFVARAPEAG